MKILNPITFALVAAFAALSVPLWVMSHPIKSASVPPVVATSAPVVNITPTSAPTDAPPPEEESLFAHPLPTKLAPPVKARVTPHRGQSSRRTATASNNVAVSTPTLPPAPLFPSTADASGMASANRGGVCGVGVTAVCNDGSSWYHPNHRGACSRHGGVSYFCS